MPSEIRATVKLYFDGKIRQWYSRGDGKGVVFLVDAKTEDEARAIMETLPLARLNPWMPPPISASGSLEYQSRNLKRPTRFSADKCCRGSRLDSA
jgi:hypothetical protein